MAGPLFVVAATAMCPHGGQLSTVSADTRVQAGGTPVALVTDQFMVAGCAFTLPSGTPQPCLTVQWSAPTARTLINSQPAITAASVGLCIAANGAPNGPAIIASTQTQAVAT
jgi:hypothetical protein